MIQLLMSYNQCVKFDCVGRITISNRKFVAEAAEEAYISITGNFTGVYRVVMMTL